MILYMVKVYEKAEQIAQGSVPLLCGFIFLQ